MPARKLTAVLAAAVFLAGCSGSAASVPPHRATATARLPACAPARPAPRQVPGMQLAASTSVGTGALAQAWASGILKAMGTPAGRADVTSLLAWFSAEDAGKASGAYTYGAGENNPLNLTADSGDTVGTAGMQPSGAGPGHPGNLDFSMAAFGIAATAQVIESKYPAIDMALGSGRGLIGNPAVSAELLEWSGGGYSSLG